MTSAPGCNAPGPRSGDTEHLDYLSARAYDFLDMVELNVGAGPGLQAALEVTPIRVALGHYEDCRVGMFGRAMGAWQQERSEVFILLHTLVCWCKQPCSGNGYLFTEESMHRHSHLRDPSDTSRLTFYEEWGWTTRYEDWERHWLDVSAEVHPLFFGVEAAVSPQEIFDFLFGLFGSDCISRDDWTPKPEGVCTD